jgi:hypothetical protein
MITEEAVKHIFHPKVVEHIKKEKDAPKTKLKKRPAKKNSKGYALRNVGFDVRERRCRRRRFWLWQQLRWELRIRSRSLLALAGR